MNRYRIEIRHVTTTPVTIEAESHEEAAERVLAGRGDAGDPSHEESEIVAIRLLEG
jgi:hypothetical protein